MSKANPLGKCRTNMLVAAVVMLICCTTAVADQIRSAALNGATEARRWVAAKFLGQSLEIPDQGCLRVYTKDGQLDRNAVDGHPLRIGTREFSWGLHFSAGRIAVHLPSIARSLSAVLGADSNRDDLGYRERGSFVLIVATNGTELYRSDILHEGLAGVPMHVDLAGAKDFTLELKPVGKKNPWDEPKWDQGDWAEAQVVLADGSALRLSDLPTGPPSQPYAVGPPFAFRYDGLPSSELLKTWELQRSELRLDVNRTKHTLTYRDPKTGLAVRCEAVVYDDFPTVEWTVYFKNEGTEDTPILEKVQALDAQFERGADGEFILHHSKGSSTTATDFRPLETRLEPRADERIVAGSGRTTSKQLSYFNLEWPGQGVIVALGWPGAWATQFTRDDGIGLRVQAGQELTHFKLLPGEEVRTPLVALQFWKGDWISAQNVWRRWMVTHNLPRPGGKLPAPALAAEPGIVTNVMQDADESNTKSLFDRYLEERIPLDYWWMDAGWYPFKGGWWKVGTWEPDSQRFPHGLRAVTDYTHSKGVKSIVWFEPERVMPGTWLYDKHWDWLLTCEGQTSQLLYLGNPEALQWAIQHFGDLIEQQGIDFYRQDFNFDPLPIWRAHDAEDRQGITEIRHVMGYLAFWDALRRRFPDMPIDTCSGGGGRDDLETLRRAVPLWRSDYAYETTAMQNLTYGIALWIPYFGTGINRVDPYAFRSDMGAAGVLQIDVRSKDLDYDSLRRLCAQWRQIAENYLGDYYPLTPYSTADDTWAALQFNRPEQGSGMLEVFRRPGSPFEAARFQLRGLEPNARYSVTDLDATGAKEMAGREMMDEGLPVVIRAKPGAVVIGYSRLKATQK